MVAKKTSIIAVLSLLFALAIIPFVHAQDNVTGEASFKSRCANHKDLGFPECADNPSECKSVPIEVSNETLLREPFNCIFLQEPVGGRPGYDLYSITVTEEGQADYQLWFGEALVGGKIGPFQAVLAYEEGKEYQGPFSLLYNYLGLVYTYMSGIIIAFVILMVIIGGIVIITSAGSPDGSKRGRDMIIRALIGMVLWFTASVILYTINPTFFAF